MARTGDIMSDNIERHAEVRADVGKGASRRLRRQGDLVPGIIYGGETDPVNLTLKVNELTKAMMSESFFSQILKVVVEGKAEQAVLRDLQRNPANDKVTHVDFLRVSANRPIHVSVPLHFVGEEKCVGVREHGGVIVHAMNDVEISCLPKDLPEYIEVPIAALDLNDNVHLSDLALPEGVTVIPLEHDDDRLVVSVAPPRVETEVEEAEEAEAAAAEAVESEEGGEEPRED
jgi:large subunit ribosomal protein L25